MLTLHKRFLINKYVLYISKSRYWVIAQIIAQGKLESFENEKCLKMKENCDNFLGFVIVNKWFKNNRVAIFINSTINIYVNLYYMKWLYQRQ